jgi:hypothetical protein
VCSRTRVRESRIVRIPETRRPPYPSGKPLAAIHPHRKSAIGKENVIHVAVVKSYIGVEWNEVELKCVVSIDLEHAEKADDEEPGRRSTQDVLKFRRGSNESFLE